MPEPFLLHWPDCVNVRDLGGVPTTDGRTVRPGALIRSDNLDRLTPVGVRAVRSAGITRIVDVRSASECAHYPSRFTNDPIWRNTPLADPDAPYEQDLPLVTQYSRLLDQNPRRFATAVAEIADAPDGCVLVHCHAGKDRTGIVVALALSLAYVSTEAIANDYAIVGDSTIDVRTLVGTDNPDDLPELEAPRAEVMSATLDHIANTYGGIEPYLATGGLSPRQANSIRSRLLDAVTPVE